MARVLRAGSLCPLLLAACAGLAATPSRPDALAGKVVILPVSDQDQFMVDQEQARFLKRRIREAEEGGAIALVLELDTYGGEVHAAFKISDLLLGTRIPRTVAFVRTKAISAGALIALSCQEVAMNPNTSIGDCEPILMAGDKIEYGPEKFKTALRARFRLFAERHGYPAALGEGMVDKEIEVLEVEVAGERRLLTRVEFDNLVKQGAEQRLLRVVKPEGQLLTLTAQEAHAFRLATAIVADRAALLAHYGWSESDVVVVEPSWSEDLARWVTSPMVSGLLLLVGLIAVYIALNHPGLGVPGLVAVLCFGVLFGGKYLGGLAESWEVALFGLGIVLLLVEFFVLPGFGVAGILGVMLVLGSLFLIFLPEFSPPEPESPPGKEGTKGTEGTVEPFPSPPVDWKGRVGETAVVIFGGAAGALLAILGLIRWMGDIPVLNRLVLKTAVTGEAGTAAVGPVDRPLAEWVGRRGTAVTTLRPVGRIDVEGTLLEVRAEEGYIDMEEPVVVTRVDGPRLVVRRAAHG